VAGHRTAQLTKEEPGGTTLPGSLISTTKGTKSMQSTTLYFREGSSDKVYRAAIETRDGGYVVNTAFGRRGTTLSTGTKTSSPVAMDMAQSIYDKLVREKMAKGYSSGEETMAYHDSSRKVTAIRPQLLNAVEDPGALLKDNGFYLQPKHDGKRLLLHKQGVEITGINRRGIECGIPERIRVAAPRGSLERHSPPAA